jgi:thymidine kinase
MEKGALEAIVGCMSCGKSEELIRRIKRAVIAKQSVIVFKPSLDSRTDEATIASRDGKQCAAVAIDKPSEVLERLNGGHQVVGFDEAQFFGPELVPVINQLLERGTRVIVSGLDTDFRGEPFGIVPQVLALADSVTKLTAVCMRCGGQATRSQRLICGQPAPYDAPTIQVGGDEAYEARCRDCHVVPR